MSPEYVFKDRDSSLVQQATLCFLVRENKILLAMKKRGFGINLWNGIGGKVKDETIEQTAKRETLEEIEVTINRLVEVAILHFYFPDEPDKLSWNQDVHVFLVDEWKGEPSESEEMRPEWFDRDILPFEKMWSADHLWIPRVLKGEKIEAWVAMDDNNKTLTYKIETLKL